MDNGKAKAKNGNGHSAAKVAPPKLHAGKRQLEIKGAERPSNPKLDAVVGPYVDALYQRMALEAEERRLREEAIALMGELKIPLYVYQDGSARYELEAVHVDAKDKLKVKRVEDVAA